jgi:uncharacterized membrane protein YgdD (TMEM256/DUF423 family)
MRLTAEEHDCPREDRTRHVQSPTTFIFLGGALAALAVGLGAIGAHALKPHLTPQQLETFHTAVQYQMYHAIGLVLVGLLIVHQPNRWFASAGWSMLTGIILFSGFLYAWLATGRRLFLYPLPAGGVAFIVGWLLLALGALRPGRERLKP